MRLRFGSADPLVFIPGFFLVLFLSACNGNGGCAKCQDWEVCNNTSNVCELAEGRCGYDVDCSQELENISCNLETHVCEPPDIERCKNLTIQNYTTYYVSSSLGKDSNIGTSSDAPIQTIAQVNKLTLNPADRVLFRCGDTWQGETLEITKSGADCNPIVFGSWPENCSNRPVISGSMPVAGWQQYASNIYVADLSQGENQTRFTVTIDNNGTPTQTILGINQLFSDGVRLPMGRWPNLDTNPENGGYSTFDSQESSTSLTDNELPDLDWTGAAVHLKSMRWLILNRTVTGHDGHTLVVNADTSCYGGTCAGWGFFLNNHLNTLDQEGEWYYDNASYKVYLYTTSGSPTAIEGSVVSDPGEDPASAGIVLGGTTPLQYVTVENLEIKNWFANGISIPGSRRGDENSYLILRNNFIHDVDNTGIRFNMWIWEADNGVDGLRGGHDLQLINNIIDGANHFGIDSFAFASRFIGNEVRNIGLLANVGTSGLGCGTTGDSCTENGDGIRIRTYEPLYSGHHNVILQNHILYTGYVGMDIFGSNILIKNNVIKEACYTKGDCGGVRTFGEQSLDTTMVYNIDIIGNVITDITGNTDGCNTTYKPLFGMGLYIDNYSKNVKSSGNTIVDTTLSGILYQRSTGSIDNNTVYNAATSEEYSSCIALYGQETSIPSLTHNIMYALSQTAWTLGTDVTENILLSDYNYFFHPYVQEHISTKGWVRHSFADWQQQSGQDKNSVTNWFTQSEGDPPRSAIYVNDTDHSVTVILATGSWVDLDQQPVNGSFNLGPFESRVVVSQ